jgi:cell division protein FtsB
MIFNILEIQSTPVLHIDISDDYKQEQFILASQLEELKMNNMALSKKIGNLENDLKGKREEVL